MLFSSTLVFYSTSLRHIPCELISSKNGFLRLAISAASFSKFHNTQATPCSYQQLSFFKHLGIMES